MLLRRIAVSQSRRFFNTNIKNDVSKAIPELNKEKEFIFGEPPATFAGSTENKIVAEEARNDIKKIAELNKEMEFVFGEPPATFAGSTENKIVAEETPSDIIMKIPELNKELEFFFGEPPATFVGSTENKIVAEEAPNDIMKTDELCSSKLTHISPTGEAQMVDVSSKEMSKRIAVASCKVILGRPVYELVSANQIGKGDVLGVAKIAGICGAKQTSNLIPMCHNISLSHVRVDLAMNPADYSVIVVGEATSTGKTGVEMEALTAVSVAGLTVYDMCKAASKDIIITDIKLESKSGGKSGDWSRNK